jgi:leucyl/phenylalanyl-tRNA---protein transferase
MPSSGGGDPAHVPPGGVTRARRGKRIELRPAVRYAAQWVGARVVDLIGRERTAGIVQRRALTAGSLASATAADIVANYQRGLVLFGAPDSPLFETTWSCPPTRAVVTAETLRISDRLRALQQQTDFEVRFGQDFSEIVWACRRDERSWLTPKLIRLYENVHELGFAPVVGTYDDGELVGGLFGIEVGRTFGIMSVFHRADNAGTLAQLAVLDQIGPARRWDVVECGSLTTHYARFGFTEIPVDRFREVVLRGAAPSPLVSG